MWQRIEKLMVEMEAVADVRVKEMLVLGR